MKRGVAVILLVPLCGTALFGCAPPTNGPTPAPTTQLPTTQLPTTQPPTTQGSATPTSAPSATGPTRPTPTGNGLHQDWHFVTEAGARGTFTVPSKRNGLAQRIETERSAVKGKRLYYVVIEVDNTEGSKRVELDTIEFVDRDGRRIESLDEQDVIERWHLPSGYAARRRLIKLQTDMSFALGSGQKGTAVKVFDRRISSISRTFVYLDGGLSVVEALAG
jgi:hypothetical protein